MRFVKVASATALYLLWITGLCAAQELDTKSLDEIVAAARKDWDVPGLAVAIVSKDKLCYTKGEGVCEIGTTLQVTADTLFAIGSITKQITAMLIAILVGDGKMDWDDPVRKHVPWFELSDPTSDREVTIRDLLCHRTGVPEYANEWSGVFRTVDQVDLLKRLRKHKPTKPFRAEFQYNNLTFLAAGYAAGKADDSTWEDSVQKRILTPLGMTGATLSVKTMQQRPNHAKPHKSGKGENKGMVVKIPFFDVDHVGPAGSINASARDMSQWLRFMLAEGEIDGRRLVPIKHAREMVKPHVVVPVPSAVPEEFSVNRNYALGMFVRDYRGHKLFEHTGGINGFRSYIIMVPRAKIGIIVLCNRECDCHAALGLQLTDKLLGLPAVGWTDHYKKLKK